MQKSRTLVRSRVDAWAFFRRAFVFLGLSASLIEALPAGLMVNFIPRPARAQRTQDDFPSQQKAHSSGEISLPGRLWKQHVVPLGTDGFDSTGLWVIAGTLSAVALTQPFDPQIRETFRNHQRMSSDTTSVLDVLGGGYMGATIVLGQLIFDRQNERRNGIFHGESLLANFVATTALKTAFARARPGSDDHTSMPSGHTSTMFATATALTYSYGPWIGAPVYLLGAAVAVSRWSDDRHWFSDTFAGAGVGFFWARAAHFHNFKGEKIEATLDSQFQLTPVITSELVGGIARYTF